MLVGCTELEEFIPPVEESVKEEETVKSMMSADSSASKSETPPPKIDATMVEIPHMVFYSQKWAKESNTEYDFFSPDDANFLSQSLKYSGLPMESAVWEFDSTKYVENERSTPAWRDAKELESYLLGRYNLEATFSISSTDDYENYVRTAKKGDLVFLGSDRAMLVTMFRKEWVDDEYVITQVFYCSSGIKNENLVSLVSECGETDSLRIVRLQI